MRVGYGRARTNPGEGLGYGQWCAALVQHFFVVPRSDPRYALPVRHLAVNDHELHLASGQRLASPEAARANFLEVFRRELKDHPFQTAYRAERISIDAPPQTIVPVIASCLVAAEYTSDENYRELFDELCGNERSNDTRTLPDLWEHVRDWLRACREDDDPPFSVRELALPRRPTTGWRNIFYSLHLTFPHRRDRELLESCLSDCTPEASVSEVLAAVARVETRFTPTFRAYFSEFCELKIHSPLHPFWHAVQNAWQSRHASGLEAVSMRFCAQVVSGDCHAYLLVKHPDDAPPGHATREAPTLDATWKYVVVDSEGNHEGAVSELLSGKWGPARLLRDIEVGTVCFVETGVRIYEWLGGVPRAGTGIALVKGDKLAGFEEQLHRRNGSAKTVGATRYDGWLMIQHVVYGSGDGEHLPLVPELSAIEVSPGSGVASGTGFIGKAEILPMIQSRYSTRVDARAVDGGTQHELNGDGNGRWRLPELDLRGRYLISGYDGDGFVLGQLLLDFVAPPAHSEFRRPSDAQCGRMLVEGGARDLEQLDKELPLVSESNEDAVPEGAVYLGPVVGAWSRSRVPTYDWIADRRKRTLAFVGEIDAPTPPQAVSLSKSAARFWRECFTQFRLVEMDAAVEATLREYRAMARRTDLRRVQSSAQRPVAERDVSVPEIAPCKGVELFQLALGSSSARQAGIDEPEFFRLMDLSFGPLDWRAKWLVLRAWLDAGAIELAIDARWPARRYFARRPRIVFLDARRSEFVVCGLVLPAVADRIATSVASRGGSIRLGRSVSPFAPRLFAGSSPHEVLDALGRQEHFAPSMIAESPTSSVTSLAVVVDNDRCSDEPDWEGHAGRVWQWDDGYFGNKHARFPVTFRLVQLPRAPDRYEVIVDGRLHWRTECRNWGFLAAHDAAGRNPFTTDDAMIAIREKSGAHLPLRIARALAIASGVTSGPDERLQYRYLAPSATTAAEVISRLSPTFGRKDVRGA